jgi:hypothetical protein
VEETQQAWKQKLADFEVPLEEFHAKDLAKSNGFFHKWTQDDSYKLGSRSPVQSQNLSFTP